MQPKKIPSVKKTNNLFDQCFLNEQEDAPKNIRRHCEVAQNYNMDGNFYVKNRLPNII